MRRTQAQPFDTRVLVVGTRFECVQAESIDWWIARGDLRTRRSASNVTTSAPMACSSCRARSSSLIVRDTRMRRAPSAANRRASAKPRRPARNHHRLRRERKRSWRAEHPLHERCRNDRSHDDRDATSVVHSCQPVGRSPALESRDPARNCSGRLCNRSNRSYVSRLKSA